MNSNRVFSFQCEKEWNDLIQIPNNDQVRYCDKCEKSVFLTNTPAELRKNAEEGKCVNLSEQLVSKIQITKDEIGAIYYEDFRLADDWGKTLGRPGPWLSDEIVDKIRFERKKRLFLFSGLAVALSATILFIVF